MTGVQTCALPISGRKVIKKSRLKKYDVKGLEKDFYIIDPNGSTEQIKKRFNAVRSKIFIPELAMKAKVILCVSDGETSKTANWGGNQLKILLIRKRVNGNIDYQKFDKVIDGISDNKIIYKLEKILEGNNDFSRNVSEIEEFAG